MTVQENLSLECAYTHSPKNTINAISSTGWEGREQGKTLSVI